MVYGIGFPSIQVIYMRVYVCAQFSLVKTYHLPVCFALCNVHYYFYSCILVFSVTFNYNFLSLLLH